MDQWLTVLCIISVLRICKEPPGWLVGYGASVGGFVGWLGSVGGWGWKKIFVVKNKNLLSDEKVNNKLVPVFKKKEYRIHISIYLCTSSSSFQFWQLCTCCILIYTFAHCEFLFVLSFYGWYVQRGGKKKYWMKGENGISPQCTAYNLWLKSATGFHCQLQLCHSFGKYLYPPFCAFTFPVSSSHFHF